MKDYIPHRSEEMASWFANFVEVLNDSASDLGLGPSDIALLADACTDFESALTEQVTARCAAKAATIRKNMKHNESDELIRAMVRRISGNPAMTNELRCQLGLHVPDTIRTPANTEAGTEIPKICLEALPGRVMVHFGTSPGNKRLNSKPAWAVGCLVYRKRAGESEFRLVGFQAKSPFVDNISGPGTDYTYIVQYQGKSATDIGVNSSEATVAANGLLAA